MDEQLIASFNEPQRAAIEYCDGASLVVAGAGSGKTRVLTYKIAYLLEKGYKPWNILALTFTNKAANEMKRRIADIVGGEQARYLWMGTFHSIFLRILRTEHESIGFRSNFTIYDATDSKSLIKSIIKEMQLDDKTYRPSTVAGRISEAKNLLIGPEEYAGSPAIYQRDLHSKMPEIREVYSRYLRRCKQADAMDFDDILMYTYLLFEHCPEVLRKYEERFGYILVDEYQDTNFAQHQIVLQLTRHNHHVCVVGDDAQSIYSFRGANIDNILTFKDMYPDTKVFKLEQNYRSTQMIVGAANSLIHKNKGQIEKTVFSKKDVGEKIPIIEAYSDIEEAQIVVRKIQELRSHEHLDYSDFAILYRTNAQSRLFEEHLRRNGMPYKIYGGLSFYQRKEIKDIIAYFRMSVNPNDEEALKRIINYPARGIGQTTLNKLIEAAARNNVSLWTVLNSPIDYGLKVSGSALNKLQEFVKLIQTFIDKAAAENADEAGRFIVKNCGILADVYQDATPENLSRQENVEELVNGLHDFCASRLEEGNMNISISDYLSEVSLLSDVDTDNGADESKVTLMTIHSAKGLEFNTVFVVGLEEGLFPNQIASNSPREIEEERRLFYVSITRAQYHCFITYAKSRLHYGKMEFSNPSRFIRDVSPEFVTFRGSHSSFAPVNKDVELPWSRAQRQTSLFSNIKDTSTYERREYPTHVRQSNFTTHPVASNPRFRKVDDSLPAQRRINQAMTDANDSSALREGQHIRHERFGEGVVQKVEGAEDNRKATVCFANAGTKQLLLKFARFSVLD